MDRCMLPRKKRFHNWWKQESVNLDLHDRYRWDYRSLQHQLERVQSTVKRALKQAKKKEKKIPRHKI